MSRCALDWPALLAGAAARGIGVTALARELGVSPSNVCRAQKRCGVKLPNDAGHYVRTPETAHRRIQEIGRKKRAMWARRFRIDADLPLNQFCGRHGCCIDTARKWARDLGHEFAPPRQRPATR